MDSIVMKDLGRACLIIVGILGFLLIWYRHKINMFNASNKDAEEEDEMKLNSQKASALDIPEQPQIIDEE